MKFVAIAAIALTLAACAPIPNTSRTVLTRSLFDESTIGGPQYPVIVRGAENVGLTPMVLAQSLRFPNRVRRGSSFSAVGSRSTLTNYAYLDVTPAGNAADAQLTFHHGDRRIGVGIFTLSRQDFSNPAAVGSISATMISAMLREAEFDKQEGRGILWIPN